MNTTVNTDTTATVNQTVANRKVGRPAAKLKLIMNKSFTINDLVGVNPGAKYITIRAAVLRGLATGKFVKLNLNVKSGRKGKPANIFINAKVYKANLANLAKTKVVVDLTNTVDNVVTA